MADVCYNSMTEKSQAGRKLKTLDEVLGNYMETNLVIDVINILIIVVDLSLAFKTLSFFKLFIITKIPQCL